MLFTHCTKVLLANLDFFFYFRSKFSNKLLNNFRFTGKLQGFSKLFFLLLWLALYFYPSLCPIVMVFQEV